MTLKKMADLEEINKKSILQSLDDVGTLKSLGYLPLHTVEDILSMHVHDLAYSMRERGLTAKIFSDDECCIRSGAIYVYDASALQIILNQERGVLQANAWPFTADGFVRQVANLWLEPSHPVYAVIQRAFGERATSERGIERGI